MRNCNVYPLFGYYYLANSEALHNDFRFSDYLKSAQAKIHFSDRSAEVVALFFYDDIKQVEYGLPFCRTQWINENLEVKPTILAPDENLKDIGVKWEDTYKLFSTFIPDNQLTKGQYFLLAEQTYASLKSLFTRILSSYELYKNGKLPFVELISDIKALKPMLDKMYFSFSDRGYPPLECSNMDRVLLEIISALHDIGLIVNDSDRNEANVRWLINHYLDRSSEQMPFYEYECNKAR